MKTYILLATLALVLLAAPAIAATDASVPAKAPVAKTAPAPTGAATSLPVKPAPVDPAVAQPTTTEDAVTAARGFVGSLKDKRWWFAAAGGIFVLMFLAGFFGLWAKIGTTWAWVAVGVLSLAAGLFAAFDKQGFSWSALLGYMSAGPTVAWLRDWIKDGILKIKSTKTPEPPKVPA